MRAIAAGSAVLGPAGAWLYESGRMDLAGLPYALSLWLVVFLAVCGLALGGCAVIRGAPVLGMGSLVLNAGVAALYGFLGLFFGFGGSR